MSSFERRTGLTARPAWGARVRQPAGRAPGAAVALILLVAARARAAEFDASVAPGGHFLLKVYPTVFYTSAYFSNEGNAQNLTEVTGLLYAELSMQIQYGLTGSFSVGAHLPVGWTYREAGAQTTITDRLTMHEFWLTFQHRWLALGIVSSSSLRVKIPLARKKDFEDGLRVGDDQVDLYPAYYFDYYSKTHYWFTEIAVGYRYRFPSGDIKPADEFTVRGQGGYELMPEHRVRLFLIADLTWFQNGHFGNRNQEFFERDGSLHTFGYGLSLWPRPTLRVEMDASGDWSGRNRYRGIHWTLGITKIF